MNKRHEITANYFGLCLANSFNLFIFVRDFALLRQLVTNCKKKWVPFAQTPPLKPFNQILEKKNANESYTHRLLVLFNDFNFVAIGG